MKRNNTILLLIATALGLSLESCNKEMFDQQVYDTIITQEFPIDPIDQTHNWELSTRRSIVIKANANMENMEKVMVLSKDPGAEGIYFTPEVGKTYFYVFFDSKTKRIAKGGKFEFNH